MQKPWLSRFLLITFFFVGISFTASSLYGVEKTITWHDGGLFMPWVEYLEEPYQIDSVTSEGYELMRDLYEESPTLSAYLDEAEAVGNVITFYSFCYVSLTLADVAGWYSGFPVSWFPALTGVMMRIAEPYFFPSNHFDTLKKGVAAYNKLVEAELAAELEPEDEQEEEEIDLFAGDEEEEEIATADAVDSSEETATTQNMQTQENTTEPKIEESPSTSNIQTTENPVETPKDQPASQNQPAAVEETAPQESTTSESAAPATPPNVQTPVVTPTEATEE